MYNIEIKLLRLKEADISFVAEYIYIYCCKGTLQPNPLYQACEDSDPLPVDTDSVQLCRTNQSQAKVYLWWSLIGESNFVVTS